MMKLSAKALRFIDAAVVRSQSDEILSVWQSFEREPGRELTDEVARVALTALRKAERDLCSRLKSTSVDEDDAADLSNDLGFIRAIQVISKGSWVEMQPKQREEQ